jgi:hypothetical protein
VLNKADKLDADEIDVRGARGPARTLAEAFARHDIPEDSEIFFLSGYRALRAQQLTLGHCTVDDVLDDNRVSIPSSVRDRIEESKAALEDLSTYLLGQSRLPHLKDRLHDYLANENKAGTVIGTAAQFVWGRSDDYVAPIEAELNLARDPAKFDELRANRESLIARLEEIRHESESVLARYRARTGGGTYEGEAFGGYEQAFRDALAEHRVDELVVKPVIAWLREDGNLREARNTKFRTLSARMEHQVDEFVSEAMRNVNALIDLVERETQDAIVRQLGQVRSLRAQMTQPGRFDVGGFDASMTKSYVAFGASGAAVGVAAGAIVGTTVLPVIGTAIGAGLGGLLGIIGGLFARLAWSEDRWLRKLEPLVRENALNMLIHGGKDKEGREAPPVTDAVVAYLRRRSAGFEEAVRNEVKNAVESVQKQVDDLLARENQIRNESEAIAARLAPKVEWLHGLRMRAGAVVEACNLRETMRV